MKLADLRLCVKHELLGGVDHGSNLEGNYRVDYPPLVKCGSIRRIERLVLTASVSKKRVTT